MAGKVMVAGVKSSAKDVAIALVRAGTLYCGIDRFVLRALFGMVDSWATCILIS